MYIPPNDNMLSAGFVALTAVGSALLNTLTDGRATLTWQATGTFVATFVCEVSLDATNFVAVPFFEVATGSKKFSASGPGVFQASVPGAAQVRVRVSSFTSGTVTLTPRLSYGAMSGMAQQSGLVLDGMRNRQSFNLSTYTGWVNGSSARVSTAWVDFVSQGVANNYVVPAGKRLRLRGYNAMASNTTVNGVTGGSEIIFAAFLRVDTVATTAASGPILNIQQCCREETGANGIVTIPPFAGEFPDGTMELAAEMNIGWWSGSNSSSTVLLVAAQVYGFLYDQA